MSIFSNPTVIAAIATVFGAGALKIIETWLSRQARRTTDAQQLRQELRDQVLDLKAEVKALQEAENKVEAEVDLWKDRYYDLRDQFIQKQTELTMALNRIKDFEDAE